ncbi:hypothetical protein C8Q73DRAFT_785949 [Cubamyces lactineus]|nr:hypothetical protein C8Q73DRAFT_785949 [Cubamyces lactineus]
MRSFALFAVLSGTTAAYAYPRGLTLGLPLCSAACLPLASSGTGGPAECITNTPYGTSGQCICDEVEHNAAQIDQCISEHCTPNDQETVEAYLQQICRDAGITGGAKLPRASQAQSSGDLAAGASDGLYTGNGGLQGSEADDDLGGSIVVPKLNGAT